MDDHGKAKQPKAFVKFTPELKAILNETRKRLKDSDRRRFMAQIVLSLGSGGQSRAQRELGWNRNVIINGIIELKSDIRCVDYFSGRGRKLFVFHGKQRNGRFYGRCHRGPVGVIGEPSGSETLVNAMRIMA
ncbi:MAG: hypothetical protein GY846_03980 [Deltaproteobacteria bacterium]|nr:hypothetical protein [Deltaproteobacteria bacterium]